MVITAGAPPAATLGRPPCSSSDWAPQLLVIRRRAPGGRREVCFAARRWCSRCVTARRGAPPLGDPAAAAFLLMRRARGLLAARSLSSPRRQPARGPAPGLPGSKTSGTLCPCLRPQERVREYATRFHAQARESVRRHRPDDVERLLPVSCGELAHGPVELRVRGSVLKEPLTRSREDAEHVSLTKKPAGVLHHEL